VARLVNSLTYCLLVGRWLPETSITGFLRQVHLARAATFLEGLHGLDANERLARLMEKSPRR